MTKLWEKAKGRSSVYLLLLILVSTLNVANGSIIFAETIQATATVSSPLVTLENVSNSVVSSGGTSAIVTVSNETSNLNVLKILRQTSDEWQLQLVKYDESNIARLTSCTIWFDYGDISVQIQIIDGAFSQTSGSPYNFASSENNYIAITPATNTTGTSYVYTYLKILTPNTSTYALYAITFVIE